MAAGRVPTCRAMACPNIAGKPTRTLEYESNAAGDQRFGFAKKVATQVAALSLKKERMEAKRLFLEKIDGLVESRRVFGFGNNLMNCANPRRALCLLNHGRWVEPIHRSLPDSATALGCGLRQAAQEWSTVSGLSKGRFCYHKPPISISHHPAAMAKRIDFFPDLERPAKPFPHRRGHGETRKPEQFKAMMEMSS